MLMAMLLAVIKKNKSICKMERKFTVTAYYERGGVRKSISRNFPSQGDAESWIKENKNVEVLEGGKLKEVPIVEYVVVKVETEVVRLITNGSVC